MSHIRTGAVERRISHLTSRPWITGLLLAAISLALAACNGSGGGSAY